MDAFIVYLHKINKSESRQIQIVNIFKRISNIITCNKRNYDDFSFLIRDKYKITSWMLNNLKASTVSVYSIAIRHAVASMNIEENKKNENICFYLKVASKCKTVYNFGKLKHVKKRKLNNTRKTLYDFHSIIDRNDNFIVNFANNNFKKMKAIDEFLCIFNS